MSAVNSPELQVDDVIDERYRITRCIGRGGMGTVYETQQLKLKRPVALKVLRPEFAEKATATKRFEREAAAASSIDHRNVVKILDFGHLPSGELYYTMELLQGRDLAQLLRDDGPLPWPRAGWIILQVVRAFGAIHEQGIVHRDIKPANCFVVDPKRGDEPDFVKILDFGIANLQEDRTKATALTGAADILGSVFYMAPEQIASEAVDARTDIYSLGIMMYELLTGQVPFRDPTLYKVMIAHQQEAPRPPREWNPQIPPEVEALVLKAIAKRPEDRFGSMAEIEAALLPLVEIPGTLGGSATTPQLTPGTMAGWGRSPRAGWGRWLVPAVASIILFIAAVALTRWLKSSSDAAPGEWATRSIEPPPTSPSEPEVKPSRTDLVPPPEQQYDPFVDPFGAPPLGGQTIPRPVGDGAAGESGELPPTEVPLEAWLPPEPWTLAPGRIAGQVRDPKERSVARANVCAWIVDPRAPVELRKRPLCTQTDRRGRFELAKVVPGLHDVHVFKEKFLPQSYLAIHGYPIALQPGGVEGSLEFGLKPGGAALRGRVTTTLGDPIRGAKVAVVGGPRALAVTDPSGAFDLWVAPDSARVVAWADGYTDVVAPIGEASSLTIALTIQAKLLGQVIDDDTGEPVAGARVRAGRQGPGINPLTYTNAAGEFTISGLAEGHYQPTARSDEAYGQLASPHRLLAGTATSEVIIKVHRVRVEMMATAPAPAIIPVAGRDEDPVPFEDTEEDSTTDSTASAPPDPPPVAVTSPPKPKPKPTDRSLRTMLAKKLARCGQEGTIEVTAKLVLASGELLQEAVTVKGASASDPTVKSCANKHLKRFKLSRRNEPTTFEPLVVPL